MIRTPQVELEAVQALDYLSEGKAIKMLSKNLENRDKEVGLRAELVLDRIRGGPSIRLKLINWAIGH